MKQEATTNGRYHAHPLWYHCVPGGFMLLCCIMPGPALAELRFTQPPTRSLTQEAVPTAAQAGSEAAENRDGAQAQNADTLEPLDIFLLLQMSEEAAQDESAAEAEPAETAATAKTEEGVWQEDSQQPSAASQAVDRATALRDGELKFNESSDIGALSGGSAASRRAVMIRDGKIDLLPSNMSDMDGEVSAATLARNRASVDIQKGAVGSGSSPFRTGPSIRTRVDDGRFATTSTNDRACSSVEVGGVGGEDNGQCQK